MSIKRVIDVMGSILGLVVLVPVFLLLIFISMLTMGSPLLFTQTRPGLNGSPFTFYKFRTMTNENDMNGNILPDEKRLTNIGEFLRRTSLDELPSLWNVLKGDMSLVGPRPLLMEYLSRYSSEQTRRHNVKPGITGWAQVNGRNAISWEEKFKLDVWYVDNKSFWLDIKILCLTVCKVLKREGINYAGHVTMKPFQGNK